MNEQLGVHIRVGLIALIMIKYFRDVNEQDGFLFINNIFYFVQSNLEGFFLLNRMSFITDYQPNLSIEMDNV